MLNIERIFLSPAHNFFGHHGQPAGGNPIVEADTVDCVAGHGLRGDRFFGYKPDYKGQVTLFSAEVFAELCQVFGLPEATPAALRRNLLVSDADLNALIGEEFMIQGVRLQGVEECRPCHWMDTVLAPGAEAWLRGRGGLRCRILTDGPLQKTTAADWQGVVLAGGASQRMGSDKAHLVINGEPFWQRQVRVLREAGIGSVSVVRAGGQPPVSADIPHLHDTVTGAGPLAGLHAALGAATGSWAATLAIDMPAIDPAWFRWLGGFCRAGTGAVVQHAGRFEPLAAIYPRAALPMITERLKQGQRSLQGLVEALVQAGQLTVVPLPASDQWRVANWNTPRDMLRGKLTA